jgi:hypothetical protein
LDIGGRIREKAEAMFRLSAVKQGVPQAAAD